MDKISALPIEDSLDATCKIISVDKTTRGTHNAANRQINRTSASPCTGVLYLLRQRKAVQLDWVLINYRGDKPVTFSFNIKKS